MDESFALEQATEVRREEWRYHQIVGKYGMVFMFGANQPACTFTSSTVANRFNNRGWRVIQSGDEERTVLIPVDAVDEVLVAIKPRKKRHLTEEQRLRLVEMGKKTVFKRSGDV